MAYAGGPNVDQVVEDAEVGYRLLLFALYTFEDKIYPLGTAKPGDLATISALLDALVCERFVPPHPQLSGGTATSTGLTHDWSGISYPVLLYLTLLDAQATFHVLGKGLDKCYHLLHTPRRAALGSSTPAPSAPAITSEDGHQKLSRTIDVILAFAASTGSSSSSVSPPPSSPVPAPPASTPGTPAAWSGGLAHLEKLFFDRVYSVLRGLLGVHLSFSALATLVRYCGAKGWSQRRSGLEEDLRLYLDAQCRAREVRGVAAVYTALLQNKFYLAATSLRNLYLSPVGSPAGDSRHPPVDVRAALTHYLALPAIPLAFDFLALHLTGTSSRAAGDDEVQRGALIDKLAELARADLPRTVRLCAEHLLPHFAEVVEGLKHDTRALFNFLTAFIEDFHRNSNNASAAGVVDEDGNMGGNSGKDASLSPTFVMTASNSATDLSVRANAASAGSGGRESELFAQHWTSDLLLQYIRLLCTYNPEATLPFLRTYVRYVPVDGCLAIVREHQLYDCVAHLLERCGDAKGTVVWPHRSFID